MRHLFSGWPRENLAQIHSDRNLTPDADVCANYYQLSGRPSLNPGGLAKRTVDYFNGTAESLDGISSIRITPRLRQWLDEFKPQIVFSQMGGLWLTRLTNKIVDTLKIPLAIHVSDDWICDWPVNGLAQRNIFPFAQLLNSSCKREFLNAIQKAQLRFCISRAMCAEYEGRYDYSFVPLHNGVDPQHWPAKEITPPVNGEPFRILYSGSVTDNGNLQSLHDIADAVAALGNRGVPIQLEIATHSEGLSFRDKLVRLPWVRYVDMVPYNELPGRLSAVDLLLVALNFDVVSSRWLRYSMLGKVAEYMISGTPVLLYGPADTASIEYASGENWGHTVTEPGQTKIEAALIKLISDTELRRNLAHTARKLALRDQDITRMRNAFQTALCEAVKPAERLAN